MKGDYNLVCFQKDQNKTITGLESMTVILTFKPNCSDLRIHNLLCWCPARNKVIPLHVGRTDLGSNSKPVAGFLRRMRDSWPHLCLENMWQQGLAYKAKDTHFYQTILLKSFLCLLFFLVVKKVHKIQIHYCEPYSNWLFMLQKVTEI